MPQKMKQTDMLKKHFDSGRSLTVGEALNLYNIYALSQRVGELKREGYPVIGHRVEGKRHMRYQKGKMDLISRVRAA